MGSLAGGIADVLSLNDLIVAPTCECSEAHLHFLEPELVVQVLVEHAVDGPPSGGITDVVRLYDALKSPHLRKSKTLDAAKLGVITRDVMYGCR